MSRQSPSVRSADEIRELTVETLARAEYEFERALKFTQLTRPLPPWEEAAEHERAEYRGFVPHLVTALAAAGLLVVEEQLGWHCGDDPKSCGEECDDTPCAWSSDPDVVRKCSSGCALHRRFVTGWTEVQQ